jgi:hypothetical protein
MHDPTIPSEPSIQKGICFVLFAYDTALSINLDDAERRIHDATQRDTIRHKRRAPSYFEYQPPPLRITQTVEPFNLGTHQSRENVDLVVYDFGAVSVIYSIPIHGRFADLLGLSEELYDNQLLLSDSRRRVEQLLTSLGDTAIKGNIADVVEDYVIFHIEAFTTALDPKELLANHAQEITQILRAERQALSDQEIEDALASKISFSSHDIALVDWNASLLLDRDGDDVRTVLEFANVELLEMRYLDQKLDRALNQAYETLSKRPVTLSRLLGYYSADLRSVAELQVDNALIFEGVNNTLKLLGDQYLARVYRIANKRFHLDEWDGSILRKLQTLESIYEKISDQGSNRRMEILEWVIVVLIAVSIGLELMK